MGRIKQETLDRCQIVPPAEWHQLISISAELLHLLRLAPSIDFDVYVKIDDIVLQFVTPEEFHPSLIDKINVALTKSDQVKVLIRRETKNRLHLLLNKLRKEKLQALLEADPQLDKRAAMLFDQLSAASQMIVDGGIDASIVESARRSISHLVRGSLDREDILYAVSKLLRSDAALYDHSATVAMLSLVVAAGSRYELEEKHLMTIAECGLFHDIGKSCIPTPVLNKPGRLTPDEYEIMKRHTIEGEKYLLQKKEEGLKIKPEVIRCVAEHHENFQGGGYPRNLKGRLEDSPEGIHLYSRIVSIADVYSALLMKRCYKDAFEPIEAIRILLKENHKYDPTLLASFAAEVVRDTELQVCNHNGTLVLEGSFLVEQITEVV